MNGLARTSTAEHGECTGACTSHLITPDPIPPKSCEHITVRSHFRFALTSTFDAMGYEFGLFLESDLLPAQLFCEENTGK